MANFAIIGPGVHACTAKTSKSVRESHNTCFPASNNNNKKKNNNLPQHHVFLFNAQVVKVALVHFLRRILYVSCMKTSYWMLKTTNHQPH